LKCIYFKHPRVVTSKLIETGFDWMLETDVIWDGMFITFSSGITYYLLML
jgi:hypothetical protein